MHSKQLWGWRQNITIPFGVDRKTRIVWQLCGEKNSSICLTVSTEYRRLTDGQTDGQTSCDVIVRATHNVAD